MTEQTPAHNQAPIVSPEELNQFGSFVDGAVRIYADPNITPAEAEHHIMAGVSRDVASMEEHGTYPGAHDMLAAAAAGIVSPETGFGPNMIDALLRGGRVSNSVVDDLGRSLYDRDHMHYADLSADEKKQYTMQQVAGIAAHAQGMPVDSHDRTVVLAYAAGMAAPYSAEDQTVRYILDQLAADQNG